MFVTNPNSPPYCPWEPGLTFVIQWSLQFRVLSASSDNPPTICSCYRNKSFLSRASRASKASTLKQDGDLSERNVVFNISKSSSFGTRTFVTSEQSVVWGCYASQTSQVILKLFVSLSISWSLGSDFRIPPHLFTYCLLLETIHLIHMLISEGVLPRNICRCSNFWEAFSVEQNYILMTEIPLSS